ncbi:hypothetical protein DPX16_10079 [Anabarilius grahami]|uniref:Uncharacterized protein n=1 Tax=Anabarilius grahami TaxID=495550 RepID=A0A3N0XX04_ANAGA|nr:hypothetical protein DPX16_10079 [Anabarilius grahami]
MNLSILMLMKKIPDSPMKPGLSIQEGRHGSSRRVSRLAESDMRDEGKRSQRPSELPLNHWNVKRSCRSIVGHGHVEGQPGMDRARRVTSFRSRMRQAACIMTLP